jgi:hypothetical protein
MVGHIGVDRAAEGVAGRVVVREVDRVVVREVDMVVVGVADRVEVGIADRVVVGVADRVVVGGPGVDRSGTGAAGIGWVGHGPGIPVEGTGAGACNQEVVGRHMAGVRVPPTRRWVGGRYRS